MLFVGAQETSARRADRFFDFEKRLRNAAFRFRAMYVTSALSIFGATGLMIDFCIYPHVLCILLEFEKCSLWEHKKLLLVGQTGSLTLRTG